MTKMIFTDSQSALAIMVNEGGSWRTRHLRIKAMYARQLVQRGVWMIQHLAGEKMLADIGTKALALPRLQALKKEIGMVKLEEKPQVEKEEKDEKTGVEVEKALRLLVLAAQVQMAKAQPEAGGDDRYETLSMDLFGDGHFRSDWPDQHGSLVLSVWQQVHQPTRGGATAQRTRRAN